MEPPLVEIALPYTDAAINNAIREPASEAAAYTRHFSSTEEFFARLPAPVEIGEFPIHHDVRRNTPSDAYLETLRTTVGVIAAAIPRLFDGLTYFFDPTSILRPAFFRVYKIKERSYLYLMRIDLAYRPAVHEVSSRATNDRTPAYRTRDLILESDFLPLEEVLVNDGKVCGFRVEPSVSQTWIGETGRGYHVQGIWIDRELTRFFSKLFVPASRRIYPYFPFTCKYRAICHTATELSEEGRRRTLPLLHRARDFVHPHLGEIEEALRENEFSEKLPAFAKLKGLVDGTWNSLWESFELRAYLNEHEQREFELVHGLV